jgi:hypothetical protein
MCDNRVDENEWLAMRQSERGRIERTHCGSLPAMKYANFQLPPTVRIPAR